MMKKILLLKEAVTSHGHCEDTPYANKECLSLHVFAYCMFF